MPSSVNISVPAGYMLGDGRIGAAYPPQGDVWTGQEAPEGWAWFEMGEDVDPQEYPELSAVLIEKSGFSRVPDYRGRIVAPAAIASTPQPCYVLMKVRA